MVIYLFQYFTSGLTIVIDGTSKVIILFLLDPIFLQSSWKSWGRSRRLGEISDFLGPCSPGYLRPLYPENSGNLLKAWARMTELKTNLITESIVCYNNVLILKKLTKVLDTKLKKPVEEGPLRAQVTIICFKQNIFDLVKNYKEYLVASINIIQFYTHEVLLSQNHTILFAKIKMDVPSYMFC